MGYDVDFNEVQMAMVVMEYIGKEYFGYLPEEDVKRLDPQCQCDESEVYDYSLEVVHENCITDKVVGVQLNRHFVEEYYDEDGTYNSYWTTIPVYYMDQEDAQNILHKYNTAVETVVEKYDIVTPINDDVAFEITSGHAYVQNGYVYHDLDKMPFDLYLEGYGFIHATGAEFWNGSQWETEYDYPEEF